jgi:hypothetical protein
LGARQKIETDFLDSLQRKRAKDGDSIVDKAALQDPVVHHRRAMEGLVGARQKI